MNAKEKESIKADYERLLKEQDIQVKNGQRKIKRKLKQLRQPKLKME